MKARKKSALVGLLARALPVSLVVILDVLNWHRPPWLHVPSNVVLSGHTKLGGSHKMNTNLSAMALWSTYSRSVMSTD